VDAILATIPNAKKNEDPLAAAEWESAADSIVLLFHLAGPLHIQGSCNSSKIIASQS